MACHLMVTLQEPTVWATVKVSQERVPYLGVSYSGDGLEMAGCLVGTLDRETA